MDVKWKLSGLVRANYKSMAQLARKLGWSYGKTYRIVTEHQVPNVMEVWELAEALGLETVQEIKDIFLSPRLSTNRDKRGG